MAFNASAYISVRDRLIDVDLKHINLCSLTLTLLIYLKILIFIAKNFILFIQIFTTSTYSRAKPGMPC